MEDGIQIYLMCDLSEELTLIRWLQRLETVSK